MYKRQHLRRGTPQENSQDQIDRNRILQGESHPNSKITDDQAREIMKSKGNGTQRERALLFGVPLYIISDIDCRKSWQHLQPDKIKKKLTARKKTPVKLNFSELRKYIKVRVNFETEDGKTHWIWKLAKCGNYGSTGKIGFRSAHKLSYCAFNEIHPSELKDLQIRHKCKFKACVNPSCLESGTPEQNMRDKKRDGTQSKGENHPNAKITEKTAKAIKVSKGDGSVNQRAKKFGVSVCTVTHIDRGKSWNHV